MVCFIPFLAHLQDVCPASLLREWFVSWKKRWPDHGAGPLFCVTTGTDLKALSYDGWRKTLGSFFMSSSIGTHSLRKGGTKWFCHVANVPEDVVQAQGGWASRDVMTLIYSKLSDDERAATLFKAANVSLASIS